MKKIIVIIAISLFTASFAFAADGTLTLDLDTTGLSVWGAKTGAASGTGLIGKTSTGVGIGMSTNAQGYGVISQHKSGTRAFGSTHDSTAIYTTAVTAGAEVTVTLTSDVSSFDSWTTM